MTAPVRDPIYAPYAEGPVGPFRWRLGLRPLDVADWIQVGEHYERDLQRKRYVRERFPATVFAALPDATGACQEVLDELLRHLTTRGPSHVERDGDVVVNRRTGERIPLDGMLHPLDVAARLVQEDLVVMIDVEGGLVLGAGSVCFPNRWDLRSKLGLPLEAVHAPVSRLNDQLAPAINRFFDRLTPERGFWRLGWGLIDSDDLYQPVDGTASPRTSDGTSADLVVRVERETLRRFPRTGCVLFTIRTYTRTVRELAATHRDAARLLEAVASMPDDVARYKELDVLGPAVAALLAPST